MAQATVLKVASPGGCPGSPNHAATGFSCLRHAGRIERYKPQFLDLFEPGASRTSGKTPLARVGDEVLCGAAHPLRDAVLYVRDALESGALSTGRTVHEPVELVR